MIYEVQIRIENYLDHSMTQKSFYIEILSRLGPDLTSIYTSYILPDLDKQRKIFSQVISVLHYLHRCKCGTINFSHFGFNSKYAEVYEFKCNNCTPNEEKLDRSRYTTPLNITPEMSIFIGIPVGVKVCRVEVTKRILNYIKHNKLGGIINGYSTHKIYPNDAIRNLFNIIEPSITYYDVQKFVKLHFPVNISQYNLQSSSPLLPGRFLESVLNKQALISQST